MGLSGDGSNPMDNVFLLAVVGVFIGTTMRILPFFRSKWVGIDTLINLTIARDIRSGNHPEPGSNHFVFHSVYTHPPVYHKLLSLFPEHCYRVLQISGLLLDLASAIILSCSACLIIGFDGAALVFALYITYPILIDSAWGLSARSLANLFLTIIISIELISWTGGMSFLLVFLEISLVMLLLMTHRLFSQVLLVIGFAEFVVCGPNTLILSMLIGFIILVSTRTYRKVLMGHVEFLREVVHIRSTPSLCRYLGARKPNPFQILLNAPSLIAFLLFVPVWNVHLPPMGWILYAISLTVLFVSVFWPLGEGYRHLAGGAALSSFGLAYLAFYLTPNAAIVYSTVLIQCLFVTMKTYRVLTMRVRCLIPDELSCCLTTISDEHSSCYSKIVLVLPLDYSYAGAYLSSLKVLEGPGTEGSGLAFNIRLRNELDTNGLQAVLARYHVDVIASIRGEVTVPLPAGFYLHSQCGEYCVLRSNGERQT